MESRAVPKEEIAQPHAVCKKNELSPGEMRAVRAGRRRLALIRLEDGSYRAISDTCPHEGASLSHGKVEKMWTSDEIGCYRSSEVHTVAICPWHNFEFDLDTGRAYAPERLRVKTYRVEEQGEDVVVYV